MTRITLSFVLSADFAGVMLLCSKPQIGSRNSFKRIKTFQILALPCHENNLSLFQLQLSEYKISQNLSTTAMIDLMLVSTDNLTKALLHPAIVGLVGCTRETLGAVWWSLSTRAIQTRDTHDAKPPSYAARWRGSRHKMIKIKGSRCRFLKIQHHLFTLKRLDWNQTLLACRIADFPANQTGTRIETKIIIRPADQRSTVDNLSISY